MDLPAVEAELATALAEIERHDQNYAVRYGLVIKALDLAVRAGYPAGFGFDLSEGEEWPVVYIELPTGQVSWHMPAHPRPYDGHTTEVKYARSQRYRANVLSDLLRRALDEGQS